MSDVAGVVEKWLEGKVLVGRAAVLAGVARALASQIDDPPTNKDGGVTSVAGQSRELRAVLAELSSVDVPVAKPMKDQLKERREQKRLPEAAPVASAVVKGGKRRS